MVKEGISDHLVVEAWAGGQALKLGKELNLNHIVLKGDAKIVMDAINSNKTNWSKIGHLVEDMKILLQKFPQWTVRAEGRAANSIAHVIACLAVRENTEKMWRTIYPECIHEIILKESSSPCFD
jgi:ribonuclease HI